jgi:hypothetical protein
MGLRRTVVLAFFLDFVGNESRCGDNDDCARHDRSGVTAAAATAATVTTASAPASTSNMTATAPSTQTCPYRYSNPICPRILGGIRNRFRV